MILARFSKSLLCGLIFAAFLAGCADKDWESEPKAVSGSPNKLRLYRFLADNYGKRVVSGQMDTSWSDSSSNDMIERVFNDTGKYPALKGFDYLNIQNPTSPGGGSKQTEEAIQWWENPPIPTANGHAIHGIVAFCWHWRPGGGEFYTEKTKFRIPWKDGALDETSAAWQTIVTDLDLVAAELQKLKDKDIPVLWRPLHEASGGWFWWGASGPRPYIALWEFMYDYLTNVKGLNNLLWVWNGQKADWFPKASTVEIVGMDIYPAQQDYGAQADKFYETRDMVPDRNCIVALTENGEIPDPDLLSAYQVKWSWFMTWNDADKAGTNKDNFWSGEYHNTAAHKQKVYKHPYVLTLDELPDLTAYGN
ncbi:MAG: glycoside hydrolase family 26 protein [Treponema sp.]|jgi:mannan endo-1,4-beta-mannosidase|nr:glycoside hydrolase family 26 protein [Treponema sp.]